MLQQASYLIFFFSSFVIIFFGRVIFLKAASVAKSQQKTSAKNFAKICKTFFLLLRIGKNGIFEEFRTRSGIPQPK